MRRIRSLMFIAGGMALLPSPVRAQQKEPYSDVDAYIQAALKAWKVPGLALAIVRDDSVIYAKGYGVREIGKPAPVTERTVFAIGSSSKAFTAAGIAMLVDEKKVSLDAPASTYLPGLQLADPYVSRELTVRDLLSHRSGLARGDMLWYGSELDRNEILRRIRFLQPSWSFRSQFGYQNLMYLAAGQVVAGVAQATWDDFTRERIFVPLGMTSSTTSIKSLAAQADVATPHVETADTVRVIPWRNIDNIAPAGSINSHVVDMAQWVRLQVGKGSVGGRRLVSERMIDEMHTPHTIVPRDSAARSMNPDTHLQAYGLGWFLQDYRGRLVVQHGGNIDGFSALVAMLPEEKMGLVILTNMNGTALPTALMNRLFDLHLKAPSRDWSADMLKRTEAVRARGRLAQQRAEAQRVSKTKPSLPLAAYAGAYVDSLYGEIRVRADAGKLRIDRGPAFQGELEHWHFDTFQAKWSAQNVSRSLVTFRLNAAGKADELQTDMGGSPQSFKRRPDTPATASASLPQPRDRD